MEAYVIFNIIAFAVGCVVYLTTGSAEYGVISLILIIILGMLI